MKWPKKRSSCGVSNWAFYFLVCIDRNHHFPSNIQSQSDITTVTLMTSFPPIFLSTLLFANHRLNVRCRNTDTCDVEVWLRARRSNCQVFSSTPLLLALVPVSFTLSSPLIFSLSSSDVIWRRWVPNCICLVVQSPTKVTASELSTVRILGDWPRIIFFYLLR